ncbi:hypothetical protein NEIFLAOT_01043 [Neisseria flavescens NRL30031/H210]|uniref:Uncharacterized protein n=1 Tax=Neisseria flavescens NRL30031/H210 TaxID=546264 RepID=C0EM77_NEIFL|nr:hypothetical protein NEIFLAOT_01043 [Neisseria flavescens NRL30031/H210]
MKFLSNLSDGLSTFCSFIYNQPENCFILNVYFSDVRVLKTTVCKKNKQIVFASNIIAVIQ